LLGRKIFHRERLYSDFIGASAQIPADTLEHSVSDPKTLMPGFALLSRIRVSSSPDALEAAEEVVR
jgi:hypothetical protein